MATKRAPRVPGYRLHKPSGQAVVTLGGKDHYLGRHGSDESRAKYQRLVADYARNGFRVPEVGVGEPYRVAELRDEFLTWAERVYRPDRSTARSSARAGRQRCRPGRRAVFATTRPRDSARNSASKPPRPCKPWSKSDRLNTGGGLAWVSPG